VAVNFSQRLAMRRQCSVYDRKRAQPDYGHQKGSNRNRSGRCGSVSAECSPAHRSFIVMPDLAEPVVISLLAVLVMVTVAARAPWAADCQVRCLAIGASSAIKSCVSRTT